MKKTARKSTPKPRPTSRKRGVAKKSSHLRGFTIIEVMIVLALVGLIILVVFVAVPTANKVARDTGRKSVATQIMAELSEYRTTHALKFPSDAERCDFLLNYMSTYIPQGSTCVMDGCTQGVFVQGNRYDFCFHRGAISPHSYLSSNADEISIQTGHWCTEPRVTNQTGDPIESSGNDDDLRYIAVWVPLERARLVCIDNRN